MESGGGLVGTYREAFDPKVYGFTRGGGSPLWCGRKCQLGGCQSELSGLVFNPLFFCA